MFLYSYMSAAWHFENSFRYFKACVLYWTMLCLVIQYFPWLTEHQVLGLNGKVNLHFIKIIYEIMFLLMTKENFFFFMKRPNRYLLWISRLNLSHIMCIMCYTELYHNVYFFNLKKRNNRFLQMLLQYSDDSCLCGDT